MNNEQVNANARFIRLFIGEPVCFMLIATIQVYQINECARDWCGMALTH